MCVVDWAILYVFEKYFLFNRRKKLIQVWNNIKGVFYHFKFGGRTNHNSLQNNSHAILPVREVAGNLDYVTNGLRVGSDHFADVKLLIAFLLHLSNHLLEGGTAFDGLEDFRGDTVGDALDALFHKRLALGGEKNRKHVISKQGKCIRPVHSLRTIITIKIKKDLILNDIQLMNDTNTDSQSESILL